MDSFVLRDDAKRSIKMVASTNVLATCHYEDKKTTVVSFLVYPHLE